MADTFLNLKEFHEDNPNRSGSRETGYGSRWITTTPPGTWRVSHLSDTGEVYAMPTDRPGPVWVLGTLPPGSSGPDETLRGWEEKQAEPGGLHWVRTQLARPGPDTGGTTGNQTGGEKEERTVEPLEGLNEDQLGAVRAISGPLLIVAGPGSGKTRVITHRIAHMVLDRGVPARNILAVTFTRRAAGEMRARLQAMLPDDHEDLTICTFHRLCSDILTRHGALAGVHPRHSVYDQDKQKTLARQIQEHILTTARETKEHIRRRDRGLPQPPDDPEPPPDADEILMYEQTVENSRPDNVIRAISEAKSELVTADRYGDWVAQKRMSEDDETQMGRDAAVLVYPRYEAELKRNNAIDFDDMIMRTVQVLQRSKNVQDEVHTKFTHVMVDEFQDTNHAQSVLTRLITGPEENLCVVGDPDQAVYGWRGADIRNIMEFQKEFPEARTARLGINYRSTGLIMEAAGSLIQHNEGRIDNPLSAVGETGVPLLVRRCRNDEDEASWCIGTLEEMVLSGAYQWKDIAVMYRTHAQSRPFEHVCLTRKIPTRVFGGPRFYDREEIRDIVAYLQAIENPEDEISLRRIINKPSRGLGGGTVQKIAEHAGENGATLLQSLFTLAGDPRQADASGLRKQAQRAVVSFRDLMQAFQEGRETLDVAALTELVLELTKMREHLRAKDSASEERWGHLKNFQEMTGSFGTASGENGLGAFLHDIVTTADVDDYDPEKGALTLITLHQAKGLEFDVVAMPGMEDGKMPLARAESYEEERRLCYVGITRARKRAILSWPERRGWGSEPGAPRGGTKEESPFLREMGPNVQFLYRQRDPRWR